MSHLHVHDYGRTGNKILRRLTLAALLTEKHENPSLSFEPIGTLGIPGISLYGALLRHPRCALRLSRLDEVDAAKAWLSEQMGRHPREFILFTAMGLDSGLFAPIDKWAREYFRVLTQFEDERVAQVEEGIVCHIRCDDAWPTGGRTPHPHYPVAPVRFYEAVAERSGKPLFFMGQWNLDQAYAARLARIPGAQFIPMKTELDDLRLLIHAEEIALSCSTFSWAAAFLRSSSGTVHIPRIGIFNEQICPMNNAMLPSCVMYDYDVGMWRGNQVDRDYMLQ